MSKQKTIGQKVITSEGRTSFVNVFTPKQTKTQGDIYEITLLFPKSDPLTGLKQSVAELVNRIYPDKAKRPAFKNPFKDGDTPNSRGNVYEGYPGHIAVRAWSKSRPNVVDQLVQPIIEQGQFYSGCYARAAYTPFIYDNENGIGISFFLGNIQKVRDGEPLGGGAGDPSEDFDRIAGGSDDPTSYADPGNANDIFGGSAAAPPKKDDMDFLG